MRHPWRAIGDRLQSVLLLSFILISVVTFVVAIWTTSAVVGDYMERAENERVARDMDLAVAFYQQSLSRLEGAVTRLAHDPTLGPQVHAAQAGDASAQSQLERRIADELSTLQPPATHFVLVFDGDGNLVVAHGLIDGELQRLPAAGNWGDLPLLATVLTTQQAQAATEVIDEGWLAQIGLAQRATIALKETEKANPTPFDAREGKAGLAQIACAPIQDDQGQLLGAVLAAHLLNNDFMLVDHIRDVAGVDTATIFFGDLRVSTNVLENGQRAIGTRISQAVFDRVLTRAEPFTGIAYVVNEWFITRYIPLFDHRDQVVGSLYVGARRATFIDLQHTLRNRIILVALAAIIPVALLALPISRLTTRPLEEMARASRLVASGNIRVRVPERGIGEVAVLGRAFNSMVADLESMVADLEEAQEQLIRRERLASMGQLAAGVAHQLNNPLGTILLFSDIALKDLPEGSEARQDVEMIAQEAHRAKDIVTALLNFARQQKVWAQPTALGEMLHELAERCRPQPDFQNIRIVEQIAPDLPVIEADPAQLPNVFANLVDNAADAMPTGGTLTIQAAASEDGQSAVVSISDTGCGIPAEDLNRIFSPFFTTKPLGQGTGLGLSIAYGIVKVHYGAIQVKSQVGKGTTFTITLPVKLPKRGLDASAAADNLLR